MSMSFGSMLLLSLAFAAQSSLHEPPPIGTRIPSPVEEEQVVDASRRGAFVVVQKLGACLVTADSHGSMALLMTVPGSDAGHAALDKLRPRLGKCLGSAVSGLDLFGTLKLQLKESLLRGAVAEALYRLQFSSPLSPVPISVAVGPILPANETHPEDRDLMVTYAFAQCLAQAEPADLRSLALSKIDSNEERAAFARLKPAMAPCLVTGTMLKTDRSSFRFMLAESLYRWSAAALHSTSGVSR